MGYFVVFLIGMLVGALWKLVDIPLEIEDVKNKN